MRLQDKIAIVVGAGQSPGEGLGNSRATVLRFAQEGARVLAVDNNFSSAEETASFDHVAAVFFVSSTGRDYVFIPSFFRAARRPVAIPTACSLAIAGKWQ